MTREARISCPHCGKPITVRDKRESVVDKVEAAFDKVEATFKEMFEKSKSPWRRDDK